MRGLDGPIRNGWRHISSRLPDDKELFGIRNNHWGLRARGVDGTEDLPFDKQINITLHIIGKPDLGVLLFYDRLSATDGYSYYSVGRSENVSDFGQRPSRASRMPLGLFIPFEQALKAVSRVHRHEWRVAKMH